MKVRTTYRYALAGALVGFLVLAPLAMLLAHLAHGFTLTAAMPLREVYTSELLLWTAPFTFLGAAVGSCFGFGLTSIRERTRLVEQGRQYTETLFNSVGEGLLTIDGSYRIKKANKAFLDQSGYADEDEVRGRFCWEIMHATKKPCTDVEYCSVREVFTAASSGSCVHTHYTKDGQKMEVEIAAYPVLGFAGNGNGDSRVVEAITVIRDLTARRRAEEEMKAYTRQIEHSNYLKGLFTDILSHDLINPAMVTVQMADHLAAREHPRDAKEIDVIQRNSRKLLTLLRDASKYAKMESLESLRKVPCDVVPKLQDLLEHHRHVFKERGIELKFEGPASAVTQVNPLFEEVMQNFLSNALKYSPDKSTVTVSVALTEGGVTISVADEGGGVPDEFKRTIFERFERGDDGGVKGSGLGLAIARRIVDLHDGTIWVEDGPARGSVFRVFLPTEEIS